MLFQQLGNLVETVADGDRKWSVPLIGIARAEPDVAVVPRIFLPATGIHRIRIRLVREQCRDDQASLVIRQPIGPQCQMQRLQPR